MAVTATRANDPGGAAPPGTEGPGPARNETELERYDRNLTELLGELRVALPGVQVLFAFLLVAPFNQRFGTVSAFERDLYLATLLLTLLSCILLMAPTIVHRIHFRLGEKGYVVRAANRLMIAGMTVFAVAITLAVLLVTHYLFTPAVAYASTAVVVAGFAVVWFALPIRNRKACLRRTELELPLRGPAAGPRDVGR
jgi:hypothetical protein